MADFPGFERVTDQIFVQRPATPTTAEEAAAAATHPTAVVLYGWGNGQPRHVSKYTGGYRTLYPHATIVAVLSPILQAVGQTVAERTAAMQPVLALVAAEERVLMHVMSNGGGIFYAATLNGVEREEEKAGGKAKGESAETEPLVKTTTATTTTNTTTNTTTSSPSLPHTLLVCDSTPGGDAILVNLWMWARAMALGAAAYFPWPFAVTQTLCAGFLLANRALELVQRRTSAATFSRRIVNDPAVEPLTAGRLYLYSKEDDIIRWQDIEAHAAAARQLGYDTAVEVFAGSAHVGHMRAHPAQYWGAIERRWKEVS